jgi:hypothetical protein
MIPVSVERAAGNLFLDDAETERRPACADALQLLQRIEWLREGDTGSCERRAAIASLLADLRSYCDAIVHGLAGDGGDPELDPRRACVVRLLEQLRQLECTPTATQRFDHRLQRVDWALRHLAQQPEALHRLADTVDPFQAGDGIHPPMMHLPLN